MDLLSNLFNCIWQTKEQREFNAKVREYGLKIAINDSLKAIHESISSKEIAIKFILQELDFANQENTLEQEFIKSSGFHPLEYENTLLRFKENEEELLKTQNIFDTLLKNMLNEEEITDTSITIIEGIMSKWEIGKYATAREEHEIEMEVETVIQKEEQKEEKIQEEIIESPIKVEEANTPEPIVENEPVIEKFEEPKEPQPIQYDSKRVNALMEEYSDIIGDIITGKANEKEEKRIKEFKEHISKASIEGESDHALVLSCFYEHEEPYNETLPIPATEMNGASLNFLQSILKGFEKQGFSEVFLDYAEENREVVYNIS